MFNTFRQTFKRKPPVVQRTPAPAVTAVDGPRCPHCKGLAAEPWRMKGDGCASLVLMGCVAEFHTAAVGKDAFHNTKYAQDIRANQALVASVKP